MKNIFILLITIFLSSCLEDVDDFNLTGEQKIVINGFMSNEPGPYFVKVTKSINKYHKDIAGNSFSLIDGKPQFEPIKNAKINIKDNLGNIEELVLSTEIFTGIVEAPTLDDFGYYQTSDDFIGIPGRVYSITVQVNGKEYSSSLKMPDLPPTIDSVSYLNQEVVLIGGHKYPRLVPAISFKEPKNKSNHYMIQYWDEKNFTDNYTDNLFLPNLLALNYDQLLIFEDKLLPELITNLPVNNNLKFGQDIKSVEFYDSVRIHLYEIDKNVFNYYKALQDQIRSDGGLYSPNPSSPPSNISNGALGVWNVTSFSKNTFKVEY